MDVAPPSASRSRNLKRRTSKIVNNCRFHWTHRTEKAVCFSHHPTKVSERCSSLYPLCSPGLGVYNKAARYNGWANKDTAIRGCFNFWRMNCMLSGHVHTLGHIQVTQFCQNIGDKLIMILHAIHSPEVETSSYSTTGDHSAVRRYSIGQTKSTGLQLDKR